jgi:16S rRNA (uracil1498-N3)-methyltransferase
MDEVIQRGVELGVHAFCPFVCTRSKSLKTVDDKRLRRWRKIAVESSRTAGRAYLPRIEGAVTWAEMVESLYGLDLVIMADTRGRERPSQVFQDAHPEDLALVIGPEGGFSDREIEELVGAGGKDVTLGRLILRTEAAGAALVVAARCYLGLV